MLKLKKIKLQDSEEECGQMNIIIGPNNSGKSTFLRELAYVSGLVIPTDQKRWVEGITIEVSGLRTAFEEMMPTLFTASSFDDIREYRKLNARFYSAQTGNGGNYYNEDFYNTAKAVTDDPVELVVTDDQATQNNANAPLRFAVMKSLAVEMCEQRIQVSAGTYETQISNINEAPNDIVGFFWRNPDAFSRVQKSMKQAFGINIGFDDLIQSSHPVRILPKAKITGDNRLPETAAEWDKNSPYLSSQGDGIKAYYRILISIEDKTNKVILVDEPEAFLHPPQRRDLGKAVVKLTAEDDKQVFIATHDSEFLRGVLDNDVDLKIFYLGQKDGVPTARIITSQDIRDITMQSSTTLKSNLLNERMLNSFFYKKTIVCESENDRSFYEHAAALYQWEMFQDINFVGVTGKEFARPLFEKLKALYINAALAVDIDYLLDGTLSPGLDTNLVSKFNTLKTNLNNFISSGTSTPQQVKARRDEFKKVGYKFIKVNVALLADFWEVINLLKTTGVYVVPIGEMESFTGSSKNDLDNALAVIRNTRKLELNKYLRDLLS